MPNQLTHTIALYACPHTAQCARVRVLVVAVGEWPTILTHVYELCTIRVRDECCRYIGGMHTQHTHVHVEFDLAVFVPMNVKFMLDSRHRISLQSSVDVFVPAAPYAHTAALPNAFSTHVYVRTVVLSGSR